MWRDGLRVLGPSDLPAVLELLSRDPIENVFLEHRARQTRLESRWLGGEMWGFVESGELVSLCHAGANLVPAYAGEDAMHAFARRARRHASSSVTILGYADQVRALWSELSCHWPRPRDERWDQPHLVADEPSDLKPDPRVRVSTEQDLDTLYPACVAMYTEEVGVSPEADGGAALYRTRVRQIIARRWSFARYDDGEVTFKAEVAFCSPHAAQVQGVYVRPDRRGEGIAAAGMAAVVQKVLDGIAPAVSLYVNAHNVPARLAYERAGFRQSATFATLLFD